MVVNLEPFMVLQKVIDAFPAFRPTSANSFLCYHEKRWLDKCPEEFKPVFYRRYVDDIFLLFRKEEHLKLFLDYFNSCHGNIKFNSEKENSNKLSFLDFEI